MADKEERVAKDNSKTFNTGRNVDLTTNFRDKYKLQWFQLWSLRDTMCDRG